MAGLSGRIAKVRAMPDQEQHPGIAWECATCGLPIEDGEGWVRADVTAALDVIRLQPHVDDANSERQGDRFVVPVTEIEVLPDIPWLAMHSACDNAKPGGSNFYGVEVDGLRTPRGILVTTLHLIGRSWFMATDWRMVAHEALSRIPNDSDLD